MSQHANAGDAGIYGSVTVGTATTVGTWAEVINTNAMAIGIGLTVFSVLIGAIFKVLQLRQNDRHHREELAAQREESTRQTEALRAEIRGLRD